MPDTVPPPLSAGVMLTVNGEARRVAEGTSVAGLLAQIGLAERKVAVERNLEIVPRSRYADTVLVAGDAIEIVHFIGGG
ncbi:sulfur carrier protein ThiS [Siccirubricoccus sp. KC 17139]|uniref:Sulfur carrier protein ThiS n=1 Tax=Siccirubricoccus soli TaxID=2899147 RepID=A0ABT1D593_9PROT|nr:sulfur carrier protein ThiS [Siccirubricoccus soli]MCO6417098.1 sulfur carrier protein ThiS [Siccirubricoccus soli]MCP2683233.1 sulfur carrier protein ThiS [Siccirubricoccus soli]